jgi:WD40 repeat protein
VICLLSRSWRASHECKTEYRVAETLGKRILVARLEDLDDNDITSEWQRCDLFRTDAQTAIEVPDGPSVLFSTAALNQLRKAIEGTGVGPENFVWPPKEEPRRAPYRGWEPFEDIDAAIFFGRDGSIVRGLDELRAMRLSGAKSLFVVLGASGSGKSSFLRAGLIPRLQRDDRHFLTLGVVRPERSALTGDRGLATAIHTARRALSLSGTRQGEVRAAAFSPNGHRMVSGGRDGTLKIWDADTGSPVGAPMGEPSPSEDYSHVITSVAFSPDGNQLVAGGNDGPGGTVVLWDLTAGRSVKLPFDPVPPLGADAHVKSVVFSPNGALIAAGGDDGAVRLWNAHNHQPVATMRPSPPYQIWSVAFSPDNRQVVSAAGDDNNSVQLWDVDPPGPTGPAMVGRAGFPLYSVSFSPDGRSIISASNDGTVRVWDVATRRSIAVMSGDENPVLSVALAHNHPWIVSGDTGGTVRFWDSVTHQPIGVPPSGNHNWVSSLAFNPDDTRVLSGSRDGNLQLQPPPTDVGEALCAKLGSNMSHAQWREWVSPWIPYIKACPNLPVPQ